MERFWKWVASPAGFVALGIITGLDGLLKLENGTPTLGIIFLLIAGAFFVRSWQRSRSR